MQSRELCPPPKNRKVGECVGEGKTRDGQTGSRGCGAGFVCPSLSCRQTVGSRWRALDWARSPAAPDCCREEEATDELAVGECGAEAQHGPAREHGGEGEGGSAATCNLLDLHWGPVLRCMLLQLPLQPRPGQSDRQTAPCHQRFPPRVAARSTRPWHSSSRPTLHVPGPYLCLLPGRARWVQRTIEPTPAQDPFDGAQTAHPRSVTHHHTPTRSSQADTCDQVRGGSCFPLAWARHACPPVIPARPRLGL